MYVYRDMQKSWMNRWREWKWNGMINFTLFFVCWKAALCCVVNGGGLRE